MAYQVLARKWRPQNFTELVGQEHVSQSLVNALQHNRLHHAYLFTGTRGVGKTTIARIFAKAINCEKLTVATACGKCAVCLAFNEGRFLDLIEVDAASRTKVEDTRELLDNVQYAPSQGQYKIYLIDEVHMLSNHSFNALLKTLEEPPPHIKFLLATTDPQKIPITVLSRCLQFNLKSLSPAQIDQQMQHITNEEKIKCDLPALQLIARAADGSMRDGLSLLDQAISLGNGEVGMDTVLLMLGSVAQQPVDDILLALAGGNAGEMLEKIADIAQLTPDFSAILQQMLAVLHRVTIQQTISNWTDSDFASAAVAPLAESLTPQEVQLFYQIALLGQADLPLAATPRSGFEMIMLRMLSFRPSAAVAISTVTSLQKSTADPLPTKAKPPAPASENSAPPTPAPASENPAPIQAKTPTPASEKPVPSSDEDWGSIIANIGLRGFALELANNCNLTSVDAKNCHLSLDKNFAHCQTPRSETKLQLALQNYYQNQVALTITQTDNADNNTPAQKTIQQTDSSQQKAVESINQDSNVKNLQDQFGARVISGSTEPANQQNKETT